MEKENPYFILYQRFVSFCTGINEYRLVLCTNEATRERETFRAEEALPGWIAVHMKKRVADMRDDIKRMYRDANIRDETGVVLGGRNELLPNG